MNPVNVPELGEALELSDVKAPSLEGLSVTVPTPAGFSSEQLQERFMQLARPLATERYRAPREPVAWGDEVMIDIAGYCQGHLIPFSVRSGVWLPLEPEPMLPGLYEAIVGRGPTEGVAVDLTLPDTYPLPALRGTPARFLVRIQAARQVTYPDLTSPEFLQSFGRGATLAEATQRVLQEMVDETARELLLAARQQVLDEVASRTQVAIPEALVDEEIRRSWAASEGVAVKELEFTDEEQRESLETWLNDAGTRSMAERRLRLAVALGAICKRDGLTLSPEWVEKLLKDHAAATGLSLEQVAESLRAEPADLARIDQAAWHLMAVDHVMSRVQVRVEQA